MANTSEHMSIRLPKNLAERVRARAEAEGRSVSGMMTRLVQHSMEGRVSDIQPLNGKAVFVEHPRVVVHGAHPVLDESCDCKPGVAGIIFHNHFSPEYEAERPKHAKTCKCLMCKPVERTIEYEE